MQSAATTSPRDILLLLDIEPNGRGEFGVDEWQATPFAFAELNQWRRQLEHATRAPVHFNWFLRTDPQIEGLWGDAAFLQIACPQLVEWLKSSRDFSGLHTHFWKWDPTHQRWYNEFSNPDWLEHCLTRSIAGFEKIFGYRPIACRFGDRWCNDALLQLLRTHGFRYDLTVEPGVPDHPIHDDPYATEWLPDYRSAPRTPYQLSQGSDPLWMIPVTTTTPPRWVPIRRFPYWIKSSRAINFALRPKTCWEYLEEEFHRPSPTPLVFVLRTGDLATPKYLKNFRYITQRIASHPALPNLRFSRVDDAMTRFAANQ